MAMGMQDNHMPHGGYIEDIMGGLAFVEGGKLTQASHSAGGAAPGIVQSSLTDETDLTCC